MVPARDKRYLTLELSRTTNDADHKNFGSAFGKERVPAESRHRAAAVGFTLPVAARVYVFRCFSCFDADVSYSGLSREILLKHTADRPKSRSAQLRLLQLCAHKGIMNDSGVMKQELRAALQDGSPDESSGPGSSAGKEPAPQSEGSERSSNPRVFGERRHSAYQGLIKPSWAICTVRPLGIGIKTEEAAKGLGSIQRVLTEAVTAGKSCKCDASTAAASSPRSPSHVLPIFKGSRVPGVGVGARGGAGAQDCVTSSEVTDNKEWASDR
ncbi:unnamed protein product [Pleuronectes platessa]|uniref:Uncharacterized protein n=1 Tax=Pleuronectes platessa TaxID=8262 RepID=A0A9N7Z2N9_PLEPL|nr:unnamed protein product [Pleuronectes platessa]